jgi:hypothetical protein
MKKQNKILITLAVVIFCFAFLMPLKIQAETKEMSPENAAKFWSTIAQFVEAGKNWITSGDAVTDLEKAQAMYEAQTHGVGLVQSGLNISASKPGLSAGNQDLPAIIGRVISLLFALVGVIFLGITILGGIIWMMAGGNEEKIGKAKGFIVNGINGLIIIFLSYALVYVVLAALKTAVGG